MIIEQILYVLGEFVYHLVQAFLITAVETLLVSFA